MWSYDPELSERKDEVRLMVGDTDSTDKLLQDEEIERLLVIYPQADTTKAAYLAGAAAADAIAGKFGRQIQKSIGPLSASFQQKYDHYKDLASQMRMAYQTGGIGTPVAGVKIAASPVLGGGGPTYLGADD